ncbi:MAG TPA: GNAT family N-acetyltransferase [Ignavibacteriaceae bacterium]|jgi:GNAT superfamily N-acetyltransferase|nr:GNAT family N-acetyltransferase [Ignavibacteriaceae bacterium]
MQEKLIIRKAEESDSQKIIGLIKELAEYEKLLHLVKTSEDDIRNALFGKDKFVEVLIAEFDGELAGQALFFKNFSTFLGKPGIYLEDLYVKPEFRGKGIGKALLQKLISIAKERNYGRVEWCVLDWNKPAIDFYKSIGAVELEEWKFFRLTSDKF